MIGSKCGELFRTTSLSQGEIVPGLRALVSDGVPSVQSESAARHTEDVIDNHLARWEALRKTYYKNIPHEYMLMRSGLSNAMEVVNSALQLIDDAASVLPADVRQKIWDVCAAKRSCAH
jgi:hypothetical protein